MEELVKLGVPEARMKAEGYGDQYPVASNDTPEGRAKTGEQISELQKMMKIKRCQISLLQFQLIIIQKEI